MALPRKILNALRAGRYTPSPAGKKARDAATRLREQQRISEAPTPPQDSFTSIKRQMANKKHAAYYGMHSYNPQESLRVIQRSDEREAMQQALGLSESQMSYLASMASKAHRAMEESGDAGELEIYLKYDFLFYHL
jgi:flagellum-specific peptidoglycan hydrolase FlgJ